MPVLGDPWGCRAASATVVCALGMVLPGAACVRWDVAGRTHPETFKTKALADGRLAELRTYARNGVPFDVATGRPVPEVRQARAEAAKAGELSWYEHGSAPTVARDSPVQGGAATSGN